MKLRIAIVGALLAIPACATSDTVKKPDAQKTGHNDWTLDNRPPPDVHDRYYEIGLEISVDGDRKQIVRNLTCKANLTWKGPIRNPHYTINLRTAGARFKSGRVISFVIPHVCPKIKERRVKIKGPPGYLGQFYEEARPVPDWFVPHIAVTADPENLSRMDLHISPKLLLRGNDGVKVHRFWVNPGGPRSGLFQNPIEFPFAYNGGFGFLHPEHLYYRAAKVLLSDRHYFNNVAKRIAGSMKNPGKFGGYWIMKIPVSVWRTDKGLINILKGIRELAIIPRGPWDFRVTHLHRADNTPVLFKDFIGRTHKKLNSGNYRWKRATINGWKNMDHVFPIRRVGGTLNPDFSTPGVITYYFRESPINVTIGLHGKSLHWPIERFDHQIIDHLGPRPLVVYDPDRRELYQISWAFREVFSKSKRRQLWRTIK